MLSLGDRIPWREDRNVFCGNWSDSSQLFIHQEFFIVEQKRIIPFEFRHLVRRSRVVSSRSHSSRHQKKTKERQLMNCLHDGTALLLDFLAFNSDNTTTGNSTSPHEESANRVAYSITVVASSFLSLTTLLITIASFFFIIAKRNHPIFKARSTFLILYELFISLAICILLCSRNIFDRSGYSYPCLLSIVILVFTPNSICTPLLFSSWRLIFVHRVVGSKAKISEKKTENVQRILKVHRIYKFLVSTYASVIVCAVTFLIHSIISAVLATIFRVNPAVPCSAVTDGLPMTGTAVVIAVGYIAMLFISGILLIRNEDSFGIRLDLFVSSVILVVAFIPVLPITFIQKQSEKVPGNIMFVVSLNVKMIVSMIVIPLSKIIVWDRQTRRNKAPNNENTTEKVGMSSCKSKLGYGQEDLERFLNDMGKHSCESETKHNEAMTMRVAFISHCKSEWSVENLYAWEDVANFKKLASSKVYSGSPVEKSDNAIKECAIKLVDTYLMPKCALEVNVSSASKEKTMARMKEGDFKDSMFDEVEGEILLTMSDTWKRFIVSKRFADTMKILKSKSEIMNQVVDQKV